MFALKQTLSDLSFALPPDFDPRRGIARIVPGNQRRSITRLLDLAVLNQTDRVTVEGLTCDTRIEADRTGKWSFSANLRMPVNTTFTQNITVTFAFRVLDDKGAAHGFALSTKMGGKVLFGIEFDSGDGGGEDEGGSHLNDPPGQGGGEGPRVVSLSASGVDPWIRDNWPAAFRSGCLVVVTMSDDPASIEKQVFQALGLIALIVVSFVVLSGRKDDKPKDQIPQDL